MIKKINLLNPLIAPLISLALIVSSSAPFLTFISLKLQIENFNETIIGLIQSFFYLGFLIGSLRAEKVIARIGFIRSFVCFAALFGSTILIQGIYINAILWMLMRIIAGISIAALYVIIESWLLSSSKSKDRGKTLAIYMIIMYAAQSFSQMFIQFIDLKNLTAFLFFGIICYFSIIPVSINYSKTPISSNEIIKKNLKEIYLLVPFSCWGAFIAGMILSALYSFVPIFAQSNNLSVSYIMTITIAGGFILQLPIGLLSDILDRNKILILNSFLLIIPSILIILFHKHSIFTYILSFLLGGFSFVIYPISITKACDKFDTIYIPFVTGIMSVIYGIGAIIGPFITSLLMIWKLSNIFLFIGTMSFILAIIGLYFKMRQFPTLKEEKGEFTPVSSSAPIGSELASKAIEQSKEKIESSTLKKPEISPKIVEQNKENIQKSPADITKVT